MSIDQSNKLYSASYTRQRLTTKQLKHYDNW